MKFAFFSLFLLAGLSACFSSPVFISDDVFSSQALIGRTLLQAKTACPLSFEFMNYTIITSRCKGPKYEPSLCCQAFKDFACPYADEIDDLSNDCASVMFSYINLYGKYPPGLFSSECRDSKRGLECPALPPGSAGSKNSLSNSSHGNILCTPSQLLILTAGFLVLLLRWV